jgi:hypothetical protein
MFFSVPGFQTPQKLSFRGMKTLVLCLKETYEGIIKGSIENVI